MIARTPEPPYVAVIFTSLRPVAEDGYGEIAERMVQLAQTQAGYLGHESVRQADGWGITVSYWADEDAARAWKANAEHREVQRLGREQFYLAYAMRMAVVARQTSFEATP
ncbi:MAG: antibiotic biosynthesis monooxygenase [Holophaga sp.]|nr:antibiotic biosynthesis monooxygenase [Holophaga sp.]